MILIRGMVLIRRSSGISYSISNLFLCCTSSSGGPRRHLFHILHFFFGILLFLLHHLLFLLFLHLLIPYWRGPEEEIIFKIQPLFPNLCLDLCVTYFFHRICPWRVDWRAEKENSKTFVNHNSLGQTLARAG